MFSPNDTVDTSISPIDKQIPQWSGHGGWRWQKMSRALLEKNRELEEERKHLDDIFYGRAGYDEDDDEDDNDEVREILQLDSTMWYNCSVSQLV